MKFLTATIILLGFNMAKADLISFHCGANSGKHSQWEFFSENVVLEKDTIWNVSNNGKAIKGLTGFFTDKNDAKWTYVFTEAPKKSGYRQLVFSGPNGCQDDGYKATLHIYRVGTGEGRELLASLKCECSSD